MAPPPNYIWTLNDVSYTVSQQLNTIQNNINLQTLNVEKLNKIVFEAIALSDLGLSILSNSISIVNDRVTIIADEFAAKFADIISRVEGIEQKISNESLQEVLDVEGDIVGTIIGMAFGAFALLLPGGGGLASNVYSLVSKVSKFIYKASVAKLNNIPETSTSYLAAASMLAYKIGHEITVDYDNLLNNIPIQQKNIEISISDLSNDVQNRVNDLQTYKDKALMYQPITLTTSLKIEPLFKALNGTTGEGVGPSGNNIYENINDQLINTQIQKRQDLQNILNL
jgi:hypothetical protein